MRDLLLISFFAAAIPFVLKRPYLGALLMAWIGFMIPQSLTWGIGRSIPFAALGVALTVFSIMLHRDQVSFKTNATFVYVYIFLIWGAICTIFAIHPDDAQQELIRFFKIQIVLFLTMLVITDKQKLLALVWAVAISLAFWGIKGGIFSILTAGAYRVWGPGMSFIQGNNEIGLALLMDIPLLFFLWQNTEHKWVKRGLAASIFLCTCAVVFTYSRGAFVGLVAMAGFLWLKSDKKLPLALVMVTLLAIAIPFIPATLVDRISTIQNYQEDESAQGRLNAWASAINVANDRITGGGYRYVSETSYALYAPDPSMVNDAHSIFFEVIGETGWIGFTLFFLIHYSNWRLAKRIIRQNWRIPENEWAVRLARMTQVSCIAYYSGGAFLGLAYWDFPYYLMIFMLLTSYVLEKEKQQATSKTSNNQGYCHANSV